MKDKSVTQKMKSSVCWSSLLVELGWHIVQQVIGLTVATNYANVLVNLFLYSHEVKFLQKLIEQTKIT